MILDHIGIEVVYSWQVHVQAKSAKAMRREKLEELKAINKKVDEVVQQLREKL